MPEDPNSKMIQFRVTGELAEKIENLPWGVRAPLLRSLVSKAITFAEEYDDQIYSFLIAGLFTINIEPDNDEPRET